MTQLCDQDWLTRPWLYPGHSIFWPERRPFISTIAKFSYEHKRHYDFVASLSWNLDLPHSVIKSEWSDLTVHICHIEIRALIGPLWTLYQDVYTCRLSKMMALLILNATNQVLFPYPWANWIKKFRNTWDMIMTWLANGKISQPLTSGNKVYQLSQMKTLPSKWYLITVLLK